MEEDAMSFDQALIVRNNRRKSPAFLKVSLLRAIVATLLAVFATGPAFASAGATPPPPAAEETTTRTTAATTPTRTDDDGQRYAARQQAAQGLENFAGGDGVGIYIGSGALLLALIVVIAILVL
jgi:hypothetical protein